MTTNKRGIEVLHDPSLNKSTAFTEAEKQALGIVGLVPDVTETEDLQLSRVMMQLGHKTTDLDRYIYLVNLARPQRNTLLSDCHVRPGSLSADRLRPDHRGSLPKVRPYLPPGARHVSIDHTPRQSERDFEKLAAERRSVHLRHGWRPHPRPRRSWGKWRGHPHRQIAVLHCVCRSAAAIPASDVPRRGH